MNDKRKGGLIMAVFFDNLLFIALVLVSIVFMLSVTLFIIELMEDQDDD